MRTRSQSCCWLLPLAFVACCLLLLPLSHAATSGGSNHSGLIADAELSASERNRRLIPYMAFYLPAPELPINQQYSVKHAAAAGAAQLRPPAATTPSRIPVPVAYMPQQHPHSHPQAHPQPHSHPLSTHYQSGAAEVYHALAVGGGGHQLVAAPVHGKESPAAPPPAHHPPSSETGASTFIAYKPLHPTHKHKTVQHFPPLSQQQQQQQQEQHQQQEQFELLAPPLQLQQFHRQRGKQSKVNLTPFTAQNTLPGHFMPIIYTPTSKSITSSSNNNNNNELLNGNTINYNKKQPTTEIVYHKNSHQTQLVADYAAEHDLEQQQQPRQEKAVLPPTPSVGYNVLYSEPASASGSASASSSSSSSSSSKVQQKSPPAYGHVSKYESYFHMAPNQPSSGSHDEQQLTPQEKYVLYLQQRMKLQRQQQQQQQQSERYHAQHATDAADAAHHHQHQLHHHHQPAQSNTKAGKHPQHTNTHTHTQPPSPQPPQVATHHSQSIHGYNTQQQQTQQSQQVLHIPLRAIVGQLHEQEPLLGSPAPTHFIDYLIDGPRQSLEEEQQQLQQHQQQQQQHSHLQLDSSPSRAPQHAFILVTTTAPYTEHAPPPPPPRLPDLLPPTRAPVLYKQQPTLRLHPVTPVSNYKATRRPVYITSPTPSETVKITPKYVYVSSKPPTGGPSGGELPAQPRPIPTGPPVKLKPVYKYTPDTRSRPTAPPIQAYDDDQLPDIRTSSLAEILHKLQASNHLPHTLTPDNIDNSIKTLIRILNNLKQTQTIVANPPQHHETKHTSNSHDYDYHTDDDVEQQQEEVHEHVKPTLAANVDAKVLPNKHPGPTTGRAGIDYPNYAEIPKTSFECTQQRYKGFFGDPETNCQVWHYCDLNGGKASFLCPNGTIFSQIALTCDWWFNVKCSTTSQLYVLNERLYKYILPFNPKFPEDYNGPIVDKYLAMKFQEMEEKMRQEKQRKLNQQAEKAAPREEASTPALPKNHKPSPKHGSGINAQVYEQSSERNLLIDDEIDDISERGTYDTYGQTPTTVMAPTTSSQDTHTLGHRPIFVSSTPEPESDAEPETEPEEEPQLVDDPTSSESDEVEDKLQSLRDTNAAAGQKKAETTKVSVEKLEVIEIKADGTTGHLMPITGISESSEQSKESAGE